MKYTAIRDDGRKKEFDDLGDAQKYLAGVTRDDWEDFEYPAPAGRLYMTATKQPLLGVGADGGGVSFVQCFECGSKRKRSFHWGKWKCKDCGKVSG